MDDDDRVNPVRDSRLDAWSRRRRILVAVAIYGLALTVRLVFLTEARQNPLHQHLVIDEHFHHITAKAMADDTAPARAYFRAPGHLYFMAAIYKIAGPDAVVARYVQCFMAALAPVLLFAIGGRLFGPAVGVLSGVLGSVFWTLVFFSTELLDVSLACVLYLLLAYLLVVLEDKQRWKWIVCGVMMGLGAITRPNILAFAPVLAVMVVWLARKEVPSRCPGKLRAGVWRAGTLAIGCILAIAPVTVRNWVVAGEPMLISAWGPGFFWATNNPHTDGKRIFRPQFDTTDNPLLSEIVKDPALKYAELSQCLVLYAADQLGHLPSYSEGQRFYIRLSLEYVRDCPAKFLSDVFKRLCWTFNAFEYPFNRDLYDFLDFTPFLRALSWMHFGVVCPFGVLGLLLAVTRRRWPTGMAYCLAMLLALLLSGTLFPIASRYRIPVVYLLMPFVALGLVETVRLLAWPPRWRPLARSAGVLACLAVFCNVNVFGLRPAHCEYLLLHFVGACIAADRHDLVVETSDRIEAVLDDPALAHEISGKGMLPLFEYFRGRGDLRRAGRYGWEMIRRHQRARPRSLDALTKVLIRLNRPDRARLAVAALQRQPGAESSPYLAQAMLRYGRAYRDADMLAKAADRYATLIRRHPDNTTFRNALKVARDCLSRLDVNAGTTRPTTTSIGNRTGATGRPPPGSG